MYAAISMSPGEYMETMEQIDGKGDSKFFESVRNLGLIALGVIGTVLAVWRSVLAHRAHKLSEKGLIIDRFQKGAQMLESEEQSVRLAGIYALRELAKSDPEDTYIMILDLLSDFVRERSKFRKPDLSRVKASNPNPHFGMLPTDLQKALETIDWLRRNIEIAQRLETVADWSLDLEMSNLSGATLPRINFSGASLWAANISNSYLYSADLSGAKLQGANMTDAVLHRANLSKASLTVAILCGAKIIQANLSDARLDGADLSKASLRHANLSGAVCVDADFTGANLANTELTGADLDAHFDTTTRINQVWAWATDEPNVPPTDIANRIAYRLDKEPWSDFVDRTMRERPELDWNVGHKVKLQP